MTAQEAYNFVDPQGWAKTSIQQRFSLLRQIQKNLATHSKQLGRADARMKNGLIGQDAVSLGEGMGGTVMPMASTLMGIQRLYEALLKGKMPKPVSIQEIDDDLFEIQVFPISSKDKMIAGKQKGFLHVEGKPKQVHPLDKSAGVIAISGAGNYSSSIEMAMALFLENKAVVHKPHQLNEATDAIWEKIFAPLIELRACAFCDADQGRALSKLEGLHSIYFTGSTAVAHAIQKAASAPVVAECGGNNPCIIVPGKWSAKDIQRQAIQVASAGKLNGGAVCGRPQTIVTSKNWPQRDEFLNALRKVLVEETFACASYYPGVDQTVEKFLAHQPTAEVLKPENGKVKRSDCVFIPDMAEDDFAITNEAFGQVFSEIALEAPSETDDFLRRATDFCNNKLLGSLGCMILVDNDTFKRNEARIEQAIKELDYGGIAVNDIPPNIWLNAYLTWGGCGETTENFVSGVGNFGNPLNFERVKKSVLINDFKATSFELTHRKRVENLMENASNFNIDQSWGHFVKLAAQMTVDSFKSKDF
ncbi:MAG: aldehyde dehydrogenase family protein [Bacteroidota bacterium]